MPERLTLLGAAGQPPKRDGAREAAARAFPFDPARRARAWPAARSRCASRSRRTRRSTGSASTSRRCVGQGPRSSCTSTTGAASRDARTRRSRSTSRAEATASSSTRRATSTSTSASACGSRRTHEAAGRRPHDGRQGVVVAAALRFGRGAGAGAGSARARLRRTDAARRRAPLQPLQRRGRAAAQVGARLHDAHAHRLHGAGGARGGGRVPQARDPARHARARAGLARPRLSVLLRVGQDALPRPEGLPRLAAARATCAPTSGSTRTSRRRRRSTRSSCRTPARTSSGTASSPTTAQEAARAIFADHLRRTVVELDPAAVGGFKVDEVDGYDHWLWPDLAVVPVGPRRRAAAPDLRRCCCSGCSSTCSAARTAARSARCAARTPAPRPSRS